MASKVYQVVAQYDWTAVKERERPWGKSYAVYEWNPFKMKWVSIVSARGFGKFEHADKCAFDRSNEIQRMFDNNKVKPSPINAKA